MKVSGYWLLGKTSLYFEARGWAKQGYVLLSKFLPAKEVHSCEFDIIAMNRTQNHGTLMRGVFAPKQRI